MFKLHVTFYANSNLVEVFVNTPIILNNIIKKALNPALK